jgi:basic membrane protein A
MKTYRWLALVAVLALVIAACGGGDAGDDTTTTEGETADTTTTTEAMEETTTTEAMEETTTTAAAGGDFLACQVTDTGGVDDKGFNQTAYAGLQQAESDLGVEISVLESQAEADYETNLNSFIDQGCDVIVTVGFLLGQATQDAANANPEVPFSIVDFAYDEGVIEANNVLGQVFNTQEAAFLAGYLAAATTESGIVGTFGGINIPPVTVFMDGFVQGVDYHNAEKGTSVTVLGWDYAAQDGLFTGNFESLDDGRSFAQNLVDEGADIVMPVAGPVGLGSSALAGELGPDVLKIIGVDTDQYETDTQNQGVYLTSVLKNMDVTTFGAIESVYNGTFEGGVIVGTLENGGVGLADFHDLADAVSDETQAELDAIREAIIAGDIVVGTAGA